MGVKVTLEDFDKGKIVKRLVKNDRVGLYMANTVAKHMKKYVPEDAGILASTYITRPWEIEYTQPYAHYQFVGEVYGPNFPIYSGGTLTGWYSPPQKYPTGRKIQYTKPLAQDHWDEPTQKNQGRKIAAEMTEFIKMQ